MYDTTREIEAIKEIAKKAGALDVVLSEVWEKGGEGGKDLAKAVLKMCEVKSNFKFLYPLDVAIKEKNRDNRKKDLWGQFSRIFRRGRKKDFLLYKTRV